MKWFLIFVALIFYSVPDCVFADKSDVVKFSALVKLSKQIRDYQSEQTVLITEDGNLDEIVTLTEKVYANTIAMKHECELMSEEKFRAACKEALEFSMKRSVQMKLETAKYAVKQDITSVARQQYQDIVTIFKEPAYAAFVEQATSGLNELKK
jgi:G3E family GTPase